MQNSSNKLYFLIILKLILIQFSNSEDLDEFSGKYNELIESVKKISKEKQSELEGENKNDNKKEKSPNNHEENIKHQKDKDKINENKEEIIIKSQEKKILKNRLNMNN